MSAPDLMRKLLDYILEQAKTIDPRAFRLGAHLDGLQRNRNQMLGLPGVDFDVKESGDHVWLRIARLEATRPPALSDVPVLKNATSAPPLVVSADPNGPKPVLDVVRFEGLLARTTFESEEQRVRIRAMADAKVAQVLEEYVPLWTAWAEAEKPRRKTISLYSDFFALKHSLDTEQTANPQELIWGLGVSAWQLQLRERQDTVGIEFQYPLITQTMEIGLDERTLALELRPRTVGPQFCFDAFAACQLPNSAEVEKAARAALASGLGRPINPFDPGSYEHLLKLIAGNLDNKGRYESDAPAFPNPGEDLVVSDAWVLLSRAKSTSFLLEDIERLKTRLVPGVSIPAGPLALVTAPLNEAVKIVRTLFRGLSGITGG
ncbi:MAG: very short patch repair endonuclease, partial [Alcaligenaceae bacterium]